MAVTRSTAVRSDSSTDMRDRRLVNRDDLARFEVLEFDDYLSGILHEWLQTMTTIAFTLVPLFFILDFFTMPKELLTRFGSYRLASTLLLIAQYIVIRRFKSGKYSFFHAFIASLNVGGMIVLMTVDLGGFDSRYYAGLNVVIVGGNLLMPWRAIYTAVNSSIIIGLYIVLNVLSGQPYSPSVLVNNLFFLTSMAIMATAINHLRYRLVEKEFYLMKELQKARDALWSEMELAKRIQTALLPENRRLDGYDFAAVMLPAREVGGDYYDLIEAPQGRKWLTIGDVSGHGVDAGLVMMMAETSITSMINSLGDTTPSAVIEAVNAIIRQNISRLGSDHYMTLMVMAIGKDRITLAGKHQDIIIYRGASNKTEVISNNGTWLGIADDIGPYLGDTDVEIHKGDLVLLFTDGITEAVNSNGEMYGQLRLEQALNQYADLPIRKLLDKIIAEVNQFQADQLDDMTLVVLKKIA